MKSAQTKDGDKLIVATAEAPETAFCPCCHGPVVLRSRRRMNSKQVTYFWRHKRNSNHDCPERSRPSD